MLAVAQIAWGDIAHGATRLGVFADPHPHGPAVGVDEDLEVQPASPMLATSMPARHLTGLRRTSSIGSQLPPYLPTYLEQFARAEQSHPGLRLSSGITIGLFLPASGVNK